MSDDTAMRVGAMLVFAAFICVWAFVLVGGFWVMGLIPATAGLPWYVKFGVLLFVGGTLSYRLLLPI